LRRLASKHPLIGDVRGKGLMIAVEMVKDRKTKEAASAERDRLVQRCFEKGLLLIACGFTAFRIVPPLTIDEREIRLGLAILDEVFSELEGGKR
ncbi:MAG: aminotransferase class III-fold pyridoxal phosphate-dependent enzyme, partial [Verrucomicrobiae bacterium]|nr:aminotransferase class III-fold pyridoxal phosphate-dependent enzyme [Verrucomicrobiae bacterium]